MTKRAQVPERAYQQTIVELLEATGWAVCHVYPLQTKHGWRTGTTAKGWPDLVATRGPYIIAVEVKSDTGKATPDQLDWLARFAALDSGRAWLVDPSLNIQDLAKWVQHPADAPRRAGF